MISLEHADAYSFHVMQKPKDVYEIFINHRKWIKFNALNAVSAEVSACHGVVY